MNGGVVANHLRDVQLVEPSPDHRHADQPAGVFAHEIDGVGRDHLRRHHEVALVLAVLVVEHDDHLSRANVGDRIVDRVERPVPPGWLFGELREHLAQALQGPVGWLTAPRPQQRDRGLGQARFVSQLGRRKAGALHRVVERIRKATHRPPAYRLLDKCQDDIVVGDYILRTTGRLYDCREAARPYAGIPFWLSHRSFRGRGSNGPSRPRCGGHATLQ